MTKKLLMMGLIMGLLAGSLTMPAEAKKKKKQPAAAPVAHTLYLHGNEPLGEMESFSIVSDAYLPMDTKEPSGGPRSKQITNYLGGPNTMCAGNTLFPVWTGPLVGQVKGDIKVSFDVISSPGASVDVRIWPDVNSLLCNSTATGATDYVEPAASQIVPLPAGSGTVEVTLPGADFAVLNNLMLQITPVTVPPFFGRVLYDVETSKIELMCIPASGTTCA